MEFWTKLFESDFMPHGHCYQWRADILWVHVVSDGLITLAYAVIPVILALFVMKRRDLAFKSVFLLFGAFILFCGATHALEIWAVWHGTYRLTGVVKASTAVVSMGTAGALFYMFPKALRLPSPRQLAQATEALHQETAERLKAEARLASREKEEVFQSMVSASPNGILLVGRDGIISIANRAAEEMFDYERNELNGLHIDELISPELVDRHNQMMDRFFASPDSRILAGGRELSGRTKKGGFLPVEIGLNPLTWNGQAFALVSLVDISERYHQKRLLEEAQRRFDRAVAGAMEGLWEWRLETDEVWMSDQFFNILGYNPEQEAPNFGFWEERIHPDDREKVMTTLQNHLDEGAPYATEHRLLCGDGIYRWVLSRGNTVREPSGDRYLSGSLSIIQERKDTEHELAEKTAFLDTIYKATQHGIFVIEVEDERRFTFSAFNPAEERLTGISFNDASGKEVHDLVPRYFTHEVAAQIEANYRRCVAERKEIQYTEMLPIKGRETWWITHLKPLIDQEQRIHRIIGSTSEITSLKNLERELQDKEEFARKILDNSLNGLYLFDLNKLQNTYINPAYTRITGYTSSDLNDLDLMALFHPDDHEVVQAHMEEVTLCPAGESVRLEYRFKHKDGRWIWCLSNDAVFSMREGRVTEMIGTFIDITQIKESEQKLIASNKELEQFAFVASHDLREPLRKIKSFGDLLTTRFSSDLPEQGKLFVSRMTDAAGRLDQMIKGLLSFSRVSQRFSAEPVDLDDTIQTVVDDLKTSIEESGAQLHVEKLPTVRGDANQLYQLFQNLLSNALKYVRQGEHPWIRVYHSTLSGHDEIVVEDRGIGVPDEKSEEIFHIFKRLHGKGTYTGSGIGLAICRKIAERHGGRVWVESNKDHPGTRFIVRLPKGMVS
jgi:PAS domain S-box-containing protein